MIEIYLEKPKEFPQFGMFKYNRHHLKKKNDYKDFLFKFFKNKNQGVCVFPDFNLLINNIAYTKERYESLPLKYFHFFWNLKKKKKIVQNSIRFGACINYYKY